MTYKPSDRWLILYRDGTEYGSEDGSPRDAPRTNVQMIFQGDELAGAITVRSPRGYWIYETSWIGTDDAGLFQHLFEWPTPLVLFGTCLAQDEWADMKVLIADKLGVLKSAWYREERQPYAFS